MKPAAYMGLAMALALSACGTSEPIADATEAAESASEPAVMPSASAPAQSDAAQAFCEVVGHRLSLSDCSDLMEAERMAQTGAAAFNAPSTMIRNRSVTLQLAVSFAPPEPHSDQEVAADAAVYATEASAETMEAAGSASDAAASAAGAASEAAAAVDAAREREGYPAQTPAEVVKDLPGATVIYKPAVGRHMRASLIGRGFKIETLSPAEQDLTRNGVTSWEWTVTPLERGPHTLTLKTVVLGKTADGKTYELPSTVRNQAVEVHLTLWQRIMDVVEALPDVVKLLTAAVAALTALLTAVWAFRKAFRSRSDTGADS